MFWFGSSEGVEPFFFCFYLVDKRERNVGSSLSHLRFSWQYSGSGTEASLASELGRSALQTPLALLGRWLRDFCLACSRDTLPFGQGKSSMFFYTQLLQFKWVCTKVEYSIWLNLLLIVQCLISPDLTDNVPSMSNSVKIISVQKKLLFGSHSEGMPHGLPQGVNLKSYRSWKPFHSPKFSFRDEDRIPQLLTKDSTLIGQIRSKCLCKERFLLCLPFQNMWQKLKRNGGRTENQGRSLQDRK